MGLAVVALAPLALLFFVTYDSLKAATKDVLPGAGSHMVAASAGEIAACLVRVPAEVVKQRTQAGHKGVLGVSTLWANFRYLLQNRSGEGVFRGLYRGWNTTILREIPFTVIQFPLYEQLKARWARLDDRFLLAKGALCGSVAGGVAAALTTPLDVVKTRIMLHKSRLSVVPLVRQMLKDEGPRVFLLGIGPRTAWISAGGAIFLGCYEVASTYLHKLL